MKVYRNKRGTEKPIEIFVALFIIIAVAVVMLKMFQGQISEKSTELKEIDRESKLAQDLSDARTQCKELCSRAAQDDCTDKSQANFCLKKTKALDINSNRATNDIDTTLLGGIGVCENSVYCPSVVECNCKEKLDTAGCKVVLCRYWKSMSLDQSNRSSMIRSTYQNGSCITQEPFWSTVGGLDLTSCPP